MLNEKNVKLGKVRSSIRELFEYGKARKVEIGDENVFDFSIGNPSVPPPKEVTAQLLKIIAESDPVALHGYTSAQGDLGVRKTIAEYINSKSQSRLTADCIYMTCGAAASLCITFNAILNKGDEVIVFTPYFPEYKVFIENAGGKIVAVQSKQNTFQIDFEKLENALGDNTKAVLINSPNNPSGVVYSEDAVKKLCAVVSAHSQKTGKPVYIISDEPYRELVYDEGVKAPYITDFYPRSIICYSYSKTLSLPGERIGYVAVNNKTDEWRDVYAGVCGAGRALGYVCAPALFQQLIKRVCGSCSDIFVYKNNRDKLYGALTRFGFEVVKPDGAFYMFVKSPERDAKAFCERAKKYELLIVPGDDFGCEGYARVSYCVAPETIERALPSFEKLAESYK